MFWYDINRTLTYNALFNFIVGNRGSGKTYGAQKWAINDFLKSGGQFIYLRRFNTEIEEKRNKKFFNAIIKNQEYPDHELKVKGGEYLIDDKQAGQAMALSTSKIDKSVPFPEVNKIIFDEFIIDKGYLHYLPDEVYQFLELYETVSRLRDNVRVFFLSNALTQINPYFLYFDLQLPRSKSNIIRKGEILLEMVQNPEFIDAKLKTRFGSIIKGTPYGDYAINNQFLRDDATFIEKKTGSAEYYFTIKYKEYMFGIWQDYDAGKIFVSFDIDKFCLQVYSVTLADHTPNTMLIKSLGNSITFKKFIEFYKMGVVYFEDMKIKGLVYEIIKMVLI